ncbi:MAG: DUF1292 domain-containing protein [Vallitaleaceae bacterium]|jgi:uncharacterized protein YrzB (UPF0473 family)|nr:DUF1292 domain-containing protein [Vallitaleaceae bacterium]
MSEQDNIIILTAEDGTEVEFEFLDLVPYEGKEYIVMLSADVDSDEDGEVVILELSNHDEVEEYRPVMDEDVLKKVFDIFKERMSDEYNFEDEDV